MKRKLLAMLLIAVTLMSVLNLGVFAAGEKTLQSYLDLKSVKYSQSEVTIVVTGNTVVDENTIIPSNVKVVVPTGTKLTVSAKLAVFGDLTVASGDLKLLGDGSVSYPKCNYCHGYQYHCYWCGFNWDDCIPGKPVITPPVSSGSWCGVHVTAKTWCGYCRSYYCAYCAGGVHQYNTVTKTCLIDSAGFVAVCPNHKTTMTFCDDCDSNYCQTCQGGVHVYNPVAKACVVRPAGISGPVGYYCPTHKVQYTYCQTCKTVYCVTCSGGVHEYSAAAGKCVIKPITSSGSAVCPTHKILKSYCETCKTVYCSGCVGGTHVVDAATGKCFIGSGAVSGTGYCRVHGTGVLYCPICKVTYCSYCNGGYYHSNVNGKCFQTLGYTYPGYVYPNYYYPTYSGNYIYIPGFGYVYGSMAVAKPYATVASGKVASGTEVYLKCYTSAATIYYTTDGSAPKMNSDYMYRGEAITIDKATTIRAIAVLSSGLYSGESSFKYTLIAPAGFDSMESYNNFEALVKDFTADGVLPAKFSKSSVITLDMLSDAMTAIGLDVSKAKLTDADFKDESKLTNEDVIYASYKIMRSNKIIEQAEKRTTSVIKALDNYKQTTDLARYRIAYAAMIEADALAELDFAPQAAASANIFVNILDWAQAAL